MVVGGVVVAALRFDFKQYPSHAGFIAWAAARSGIGWESFWNGAKTGDA